ncbi:hypothetical protein [Terrabacter sp. Ter38]|uniref:hypothetical protein n=1 Tax=Terrabacter sp. Ter38 TaxID=2926030 RepID=UPI002117CCB3|nr:hypothetical protein [Terrabacter sp. Ter38]
MTERRTRLAGVALGGAGILLAASTVVWPTKIVAVRVPEVGDFTKGYEQLIWAWGREVVYSSDGVLLDAFSGPDPVPRAVLLVVVLLLATAGLTARLVRGGRPGELASGVGLALALATVAASVVQRLSVDDRTIGLQPGLVVVTTTVGWLEVTSVVVLTAALAVLVVPVLLPRVADSVTGTVDAVAGRLRQRRALVEATPPLVATLMEPGPIGSGRAPTVGFTDDPSAAGADGAGSPPTEPER